eukprot:TRINITY_DN23493_c0_g1_i5.p1 TRINITY_DN23493_c0_g1~~TRINITY_DN23493_c0_g1_i5.p1  ORF type:complete len:948 (-),score=131.35 TRINITY_DN23493_c0_g1_i5:318-3092(-)
MSDALTTPLLQDDDGSGRRVSFLSKRSDEGRGGRPSNDGDISPRSAATEANNDDIHVIKATTMHNMVEELQDVDGALRQVVFLTNTQAKIIMKSPERVKRLVDALGMPQPKLLINLLPSFDGTDLILNGEFMEPSAVPGLEGIRCGDEAKGKFVFAHESKEEYYRTARRLMDFMREVILPLAVETHAVVLCDASYGQCFLASAFGKTVALERAKWGHTLPFTILGVCSAMPLLYKNPDDSAKWRHIRRSSRQWRQRDRRMVELMEDHPGWGFHVDLDPNVTSYLLVDSINEHRGGKIGDMGPANMLLSSIITHFRKTIPTFGIKTGMSWKEKPGERFQTGMSVVVDMLAAGVPVIGLDLRHREEAGAEAVSGALGDNLQYQMTCFRRDRDSIRFPEFNESHFPDTHDICALSFFQRVLHGRTVGDRSVQMVALYQAIKNAESRRQGKEISDESWTDHSATVSEKDDMTQEQQEQPQLRRHIVSDDSVLEFIVEGLYSSAWDWMPMEKRNGAEKYQDFYCDYIQNWLQQAKIVLNSEHFIGLNTMHIKEGTQVLRELVKLDSLPYANSLEGLRLLRRLWDHHDICMHRAEHYKVMSKRLYVLQLGLQLALVICGAFMQHAEKAVQDDSALGTVVNLAGVGEDGDDGSRLAFLPFLISTVASILIAVNALLNPVKRWRQLRGSALALESIAWKYRTRVEDFAIKPNLPCAPESALSEYLRTWLDELVSGTDLESSDLGKKYEESIFVHHQREKSPKPQSNTLCDDFQSPAKPNLYIDLRITPAKEFYSARIAPYNFWRYAWIVLGLLCTGSSAMLSFLGSTAYVGIPSALANALSAWSEFTDIGHKMERYNGVVRKLDKLLIWWDGLGEVEQAASVNVRALVNGAEHAITGEYQTWQAISVSNLTTENVSVQVTKPVADGNLNAQS